MNHRRPAPLLGPVTSLLPCLALAAAACGGSPPPVEAPAADDAPAERRRAAPSLDVQSEIGAMNEQKTQRAFERAAPKLSRCFEKGAERLPYLGGEIRFAVRVTQEGSTRWAHIKDSTLGDHQTEECMLGVIKGVSWPKPVGGEGLAENVYTFEPNERPAVDWAPEQLGDPYKKALPTLSSCRTSAGTGPLKATLYIETDGKAAAVGVSTADERGEAATRCVIDALQALKFPSPGSYASKVTVVID